MPLRLHDDDPDLIKHRLREALRKKCLGQLELRRPDTFAGVQNGVDRDLTMSHLSGALSSLEASLLRGVLTGATWTSLRAYRCGLRTEPICPYCHSQTEDEPHIFFICNNWEHVRSLHISALHQAAIAASLSVNPDDWPPCVRNCGLIPTNWSCTSLSDYAQKTNLLRNLTVRLHSLITSVLLARMRF